MKKLLYASVLLCLVSSTTNAQTRNVPPGSGGYSPGYTLPNIIGGTAIPISQAPYQVSMKIGGSHACGGSIISDRWILTAAHCIVLTGATTSNTTIQAGHADQTSGLGQIRSVSAIYVHPGYNSSTNENDVALLYLGSPLNFNHDVMPIEYANMCNTTTADVTPSTSAFLTGWGITCNSCGVSQFLNGVTMPLITQSNAMTINTGYNPGYTANVSANMLPFYNPGTGAAPGDSGGPAVIDKNGNKINIGASSWGYWPKDQLPTIYANIRNYGAWIETTTGFSISAPNVDLYSKDKPWDMGFEPSNVNYLWESEDIWVRNQNDGITNQVHENPEYYAMPGNHNYIYVRVRNRGCMPSSGTNKVKLYWAKAATALSWPAHWNGSLSVGGNSLGDYIGEYTLSTIQPGDAEIATIQWNCPDPANYVGLSTDPLVFAEEPHHFCIVARIESTVDPIGTEISDLATNVNNNNNIVWKNLTVVDQNTTNVNPFSANVLVGNAWERRGTYDLIFANPDYYTGNPITREAEIKITLDAPLWRKWREGGMRGTNVRVANADKFQIVLVGGMEGGALQNITLAPGERYLVNTAFNFLTATASDKTEFGFNILQRSVEERRIVGGEQFTVRRKERRMFSAQANGDQEIIRDGSANLSAFPLAEQATYNWYDESGKLIYTGEDFNVSPAVTTKYKLEVIAKSDGFKDYVEVEVKVKKHFIKGVFPNPSNGSGTLNINYDATEASSAYIMLVPLNTGISSQYLINTKLNAKSIDISDYAPGQYAIVLVCNGEIADYKTTAIN